MGNCCSGLREQFDDRQAARDLRRFRRRGASRPTRRLVAAIRAEGVQGETVLDIGGGVGAIQHLLLEAGAASTVDVDVSAAYAGAAREEGSRRGNEGRMSFLVGDAVELAHTLPTAGVVTLDRVICCYPDMPRLVEASTGRAARLYGVVYPRSSSPFRLAARLANLFLRLRGSDFRVHIHPTGRVDEEIRKRGFVPVHGSTGLVWQVFLYARRQA